jgi:two-component system chemotaxis sensor kinase CheA
MMGAELAVEIEDDGAGIDWDAVRHTAVRQGLPHANHAELVDAIFASGVTTSATVTKLSGRGIGLASVRRTVEERGGRVAVESRKGIGTSFKFTFSLPELSATVAASASASGQTAVATDIGERVAASGAQV